MKINYTFRISPQYLGRLKQLAEESNRSTSNYIETLIKKHIDDTDMPYNSSPIK